MRDIIESIQKKVVNEFFTGRGRAAAARQQIRIGDEREANGICRKCESPEIDQFGLCLKCGHDNLNIYQDKQIKKEIGPAMESKIDESNEEAMNLIAQIRYQARHLANMREGFSPVSKARGFGRKIGDLAYSLEKLLNEEATGQDVYKEKSLGAMAETKGK